jgi:hypothetical protein
MDERWNDMMQKMVNREREELMLIAKTALDEVIGIFRNRYPNDWTRLTLYVIASALAADRTLTVEERQFVGELLNVSPKRVQELAYDHDDRVDMTVKKLGDSLTQKDFEAMLELVLALIACDQKISWQENKFAQWLCGMIRSR